MDLMTMIVICAAVFTAVGIALFFILNKINLLRRYALFITLFVTVCMIVSLFYVQSATLPPELNFVPAQSAELRGFPLSILTTSTLNGQTTTNWTGWKSGNQFGDEVFYLLIALVLLAVYKAIEKGFAKGTIKPQR